MTPERSFERRWALTLLEEVLNRLRTVYEQEGVEEIMETKQVCPSCQRPLPPDVPMGWCPECLIKSGFNTGNRPR
jgi:hypothetical protein